MAAVEAETAAQLFARLTGKPNLQNIENRFFGHDEANTGQVNFAEISGDTSFGKTEVLLHLTINTILPKLFDELDINGLNNSVVYIDTEYKFPMIRFIGLLEQRLLAISNLKRGQDDSVSSENFVKNCLQRFFKVNCSTSLELIVTLYSLSRFFQSNPDTTLLIIDNVCSYQWIDELESENEKRKSSKITTFSQIHDILNNLIVEYGISVVITRPESFINSTFFQNSSQIYRYCLQKQNAENYNYAFSKKTGKKTSMLCKFGITGKGIEFGK